MTPTKKKSSLEDALTQINKQYGAGSILRMGESPDVNVGALSTGILCLDHILGIGGLPFGRIVEIYGPQSSGKTTVTLHTVAQAQKAGLTCAFIDVEHSLDPIYATKLGVNTDDLLISQPATGEEALDILQLLVETGEVGVVVVDSVAAMAPRAEIEGEFGDVHVGLMARMMGQGMRKLVDPIYDNKVLSIWTNQLRENIGNMYGPSEFTPGGRALPYYASVRLDIRRIKTEKKDNEAIANRTRVKVVKNKVGVPYRECEFDIEYGIGAASEGILVDLALDGGHWVRKGAWIVTPDGETVAQGRDAAKKRLREDSAYREEIEKEVRAWLTSL